MTTTVEDRIRKLRAEHDRLWHADDDDTGHGITPPETAYAEAWRESVRSERSSLSQRRAKVRAEIVRLEGFSY